MKTSLSKNRKNNQKGFSLLEMLVSIFIFSIIMTVVTTTFIQVFNSREKAKDIQSNIEDARYAMELIAKSLRMSNVKSDDATSADNIVVYDYSQNSCIKYFMDNDNKLKMSSDGSISENSCDSLSVFSDTRTMMAGNLQRLSLDIERSNDNSDGNPKKIGRVTMAMTICADDDVSACKTKETIQTTVSLRDYGYVTDAP